MKHFQDKVVRSLVTGAALALSNSALAAGFQLVEHSASGMGRAYAGEAAIADDASVLAANPAAMSLIEKTTFSGALSYIDPNVEVDGTRNFGAGPNLDAGKDSAAPSALVPAVYFVHPLNDQVTLGIGAFSNFGLETEYGNDYGASDIANKTSIKTVNINPSVAYKLNDQLSLGFGVNYIRAEAELISSVPKTSPLYSGATLVDLSGDGDAWGWNAGVLWNLSQNTRLGLSYRSKLSVKLEGDMESAIVPGYNDSGSLTVDLPDITELSLFQRINDQLAVHASVTYMGWENFDKLEVKLNGGDDIVLKEENWDDSIRYAIGATYNVDSYLTLRAGLALDETPVAEENRSLSIPDADRMWYSIGATYKVNANLSVDAGYTHLNGDKVYLSDESNFRGEFNGSSEGDANLYSVQLNWVM
ncbi:outer membrane protein transport protein [Hahella sp. CR1]|uniref:OmpP1/FadL family transporter n=1 Tax=Hahella sp. CR1 TaxID=2992807 RepID=UPI002441E3FC|nr:outer membrane protein transport protein [Hahella sp. CR1]MDG9666586.1 outer membrane protein transport protein [Hahella sp. CR1]